jgi:hypothetical protein
MELNATRVFEIFQAKGMTSLFHANSVITATQFLREGALLSRGTVAGRGMFQSAQSSDASDKEQSVWFDVFADSVDIHGRASQWNVVAVQRILDTSLLTLKPSFRGSPACGAQASCA